MYYIIIAKSRPGNELKNEKLPILLNIVDLEMPSRTQVYCPFVKTLNRYL